MNLDQHIRENQAKVIDAWFEATVADYKADTTQFLKSESDAFHNPVGAQTKQALKGILEAMLNGTPVDDWSRIMDTPIRIRAVQGFKANDAVSFVFLLKGVLRRLFKKEIRAAKTPLILDDWDNRIDQLALVVFKVYMECREKIFDLKANESKNRTLRAFERAGLLRELPEENETPKRIIS